MASGTFTVDTRNGGSTQGCSFGHDRFFEATEKLDVQIDRQCLRSSPVQNGVGKKFLKAHQLENIQGRSFPGRVFAKER